MPDIQESPSKELLDCPFCGEAAKKTFAFDLYAVECGNACSQQCDYTEEKAIELWNTRAPSKNEDPEGLIHSYVASRKLANKMNVAVTLHYEGHDYTVKPMRLGEKVNKLKEQLTATQQSLDTAVEALKAIRHKSYHYLELDTCDYIHGLARAALASIKE